LFFCAPGQPKKKTKAISDTQQKEQQEMGGKHEANALCAFNSDNRERHSYDTADYPEANTLSPQSSALVSHATILGSSLD